MAKIIVDDREHNVIPYFKSYKFPPNVEYEVSRINYGDYSIIYKNTLIFLIERKTWSDLASSIKDGRKNNVDKLIKMRNDTGCQLIYLIEGNPIPSRSSKFGRIPYKNLRSHLDHLAFRDNIHIMHSKNQHDTVVRIVEIIQNYSTIKFCNTIKTDQTDQPEQTNQTNQTEIIRNLKTIQVVSDITIIYKLWCCVPYITEKTACMFINCNYHISDLILGKISKDDIYKMKYPNDFIIGKRSTKIWNNSRPTDINKKIFIKMLSQINGITKQTASIILDIISIEDLMMNRITVDTLSKIKKTETRKLGITVANKIIKYFIKVTNNI